jgi:hypothetical protein
MMNAECERSLIIPHSSFERGGFAVARLLSQAKLGYYPAPQEVVQHLRQAFTFDPGVRVLDPCCGAGETLAVIAGGCSAETYGLELEHDRFNEAKEKLGQVLWGDALKETSVSCGFDMIYLNPPYDFEEGEEKNQRLEYRFLTKYRRALSHQGLMVMAFPLTALKSELLADEITRLSDLNVLTFPTGELFDRFHQLLLFGWKRTVTEMQRERNRALLKRIVDAPANLLPGMLGTTEKLGRYQVHKVHSDRPLEFQSQRIDPERVLDLVSASSIWRDFFGQVDPPSMSSVSPLVPMRQGHLAMLVAAGFCNGAEIVDPEDSSRTMLVKGSIKRSSNVESTEKTDTHDVTHVVHSHKIRIRMLSIGEAEIHEIE